MSTSGETPLQLSGYPSPNDDPRSVPIHARIAYLDIEVRAHARIPKDGLQERGDRGSATVCAVGIVGQVRPHEAPIGGEAYSTGNIERIEGIPERNDNPARWEHYMETIRPRRVTSSCRFRGPAIGCEPLATDLRMADSECPRRLPQRQVRHCRKSLRWNFVGTTAKADAVRFRARQPGMNAFLQAILFELRECRQKRELQLATRGTEVDSLVQTGEREAAMTFDFTMFYSVGSVPPTARAESVWIWSIP